MIAVSRGPYCTGALTPSGACALVAVPHPQRRLISWCSITRGRIGGRSNTCRCSRPTSGAPTRSSPQPRQQPGSCAMTSSGTATGANVEPGCPSCPPGLRAPRRRSERGAGLANPSELGGLEELREFCPSWRRNSAISAAAAANSPRSCPITASRCASAPSTTDSCSRSSATATDSSGTAPSSTSAAQDQADTR